MNCQSPECDKPIPAYRGPLAKYCTPQCASRAKYLHSREGVVIVIGTPRECLWCKAPFTSKTHNQAFCSTDCYQTYWRQPENKRRRAKQGSGPDDDDHWTTLGRWNTPAERRQKLSESQRIDLVVEEAAANGTLGSITPGRSASDDRNWTGGWRCKRVG